MDSSNTSEVVNDGKMFNHGNNKKDNNNNNNNNNYAKGINMTTTVDSSIVKTLNPQEVIINNPTYINGDNISTMRMSDQIGYLKEPLINGTDEIIKENEYIKENRKNEMHSNNDNNIGYNDSRRDITTIKPKKKQNKYNKILIDKNNLFHEINNLIKKRLNISEIVHLDMFQKHNNIRLEPRVVFSDYEEVSLDNKISREVTNFLKICLDNGIPHIEIYSSLVELRGTFTEELINLPICNQTILQKMDDNSYKCNYNIEIDVLNYIYVHLFQISKSKYKFQIQEKKFEIEEYYYYDLEEEAEKEKKKKKNDKQKNVEEDENREKENEQHEVQNTDSESNDSDVLIQLYREENKLENVKKEIKKSASVKRKSFIDKDKLFIENLKKMLEEDTEKESVDTLSANDSDSSSSISINKNRVFYKRKIIYSMDKEGNTLIHVFKEVENETLYIYYPNSSYNQCLNFGTYDRIGPQLDESEQTPMNYYDIYFHKEQDKEEEKKGVQLMDMTILNEPNLKVKERYIKDLSIYSFRCDEKYKGSDLYFHTARCKKVKNVSINYDISFEDFENNVDIIKKYERTEENENFLTNRAISDDKKKGIGKLFEMDDKSCKVNIDIYMDIKKAIQEFKKKYGEDNITSSYASPREEEINTNEAKRIHNTNRIDYIITYFYKNCECFVKYLNSLKTNSTKFDYYFPKMIGDVNEEIRKHYDKKKVILLNKSRIKFIRLFNNEIKRILILFFIPYESKVLDLACGHGQDTLKYSSVNTKVYIGLDISQKEIELAIERLRESDQNGLCTSDQFVFLQADILNNKYYKKWKAQDIKFNIISINLALHYVMYNEKSSKKFLKIIEDFLDCDGIFYATTISTITLTDYMMTCSQVEYIKDSISITIQNDLFLIRFDEDNLVKIFENKVTLEDFILYIQDETIKKSRKDKYEFFATLIRNSLDNILGIKYYFFLYDTIDAHEFVIPHNYLKKKMEELQLVEVFNNTAVQFLKYITNNLEMYEKYKNLQYFSLINKTIDQNILDSIRFRIHKIRTFNTGEQMFFDICKLYHVYVFKKNFDPCILGIL